MIGLLARYRYTTAWTLYVTYLIVVYRTVEALQ